MRQSSDDAVTVVVADDDDELRSIVAQALRGEGYVVSEAHDGAELIEMLDEGCVSPDVVIVDVRMPRLSGLGVLAALNRVHWNLPVVVMTAMRDRSVDTMARRMGAVGVLHKPFDPDDLLIAVRNASSIRALHGP
jgi:DNA-binding NtrC family response regulator